MRAPERCLPRGRNRAPIRKNTGTQPGPGFTGKAGLQRSTAQQRNDQIAGSSRPCCPGPQLQILMEGAEQTREIPRFTHDSVSRKNLLEMQLTLPSCLTPFVKAPLQKEQTERAVWEAKGTQPLAQAVAVGNQADRLSHRMPFCLSGL